MNDDYTVTHVLYLLLTSAAFAKMRWDQAYNPCYKRAQVLQFRSILSSVLYIWIWNNLDVHKAGIYLNFSAKQYQTLTGNMVPRCIQTFQLLLPNCQ